jgi:oxygen-independent coproporphyrinogen-3 oxidase
MGSDLLPSSLIQKYSVAVPRYTSYPTALEMREQYSLNQWHDAVRTELGSSPASLALYVHVPFCETLCFFCACNKQVTRDKDVVAPYLEALERELALYAELGAGAARITQLHLGGGTPNYLSPQQLRRLCAAIRSNFPKQDAQTEYSVELDPRRITEQHLDTFFELGFRRFSLGIQDFDEKVQRAINRVQPYDLVDTLVQQLRSRGASSISFDLVYGLPGQTLASFDPTLQQVLALRPDRLALYGYAHVTWMTQAQQALERYTLPTPEQRIALLQRAITTLSASDYLHIGMDHFALRTDTLAEALREGKVHRNFMGYTTSAGERVLGFGPSAISTLDCAMVQNQRVVKDYQDATSSGQLALERGCERTRDDRVRSYIITALLCRRCVTAEEIKQHWGLDFFVDFYQEIEDAKALAADGLVEIDRTALRTTELGTFFLRNIAAIFDRYLQRHRAAAAPAFSQAL